MQVSSFHGFAWQDQAVFSINQLEVNVALHRPSSKEYDSQYNAIVRLKHSPDRGESFYSVPPAST
jgi:hypothetical protein